MIKAQNWLGFNYQIPNYLDVIYNRSSDNKLYIAGPWLNVNIGGKTLNGIASYDGLNFDSVGCGINPSVMGQIRTIMEFQGNLYAGGLISYMGNTHTQGIAKWNGTKWDSLGEQLNGSVSALKVWNNELYIGGYFWKIGNNTVYSIAKYDGTNWTNLNFPYNTGGVPSLTSIEVFNNELYVSGNIQDSSGNNMMLAKYDGVKWKKTGISMQGVLNDVTDMEVYNGNLYIGGDTYGFNMSGLVKYSGGTTWVFVAKANSSDTASPRIEKLNVINNKLYAVGVFNSVEGITANSIAYWNDTIWCAPPTGNQHYIINEVEQLNNKIFIGGGFDFIGADEVPYFAQLNTTVTACSSPVSIKEFSDIHYSLKIYPNPASNILYLESEQEFNAGSAVEIINALGQTVLKLPYNAEIDVSGISRGYYILQVITNSNQRLYSKFVKQ